MDPFSKLLLSKTFFHEKNRPKSFFANADAGYDGRSFRRRGGEKKTLFFNFQRSEFLCFWSVNRASVKELIYQKKNGGHQASKRVISM